MPAVGHRQHSGGPVGQRERHPAVALARGQLDRGTDLQHLPVVVAAARRGSAIPHGVRQAADDTQERAAAPLLVGGLVKEVGPHRARAGTGALDRHRAVATAR